MKGKRILLLLSLLLLIPAGVWAAGDLVAPTREFYVNDQANLLSPETEEIIVSTGEELSRQVGAQVVVLTLPRLPENMTTAEAAVRIFQDWGIGDRDKDNGILLLVTMEEREYRMEVGYGLEGPIPDMVANKILNGMKEYFKEGDMEGGILYAFQRTIDLIEEEYDISVDSADRQEEAVMLEGDGEEEGDSIIFGIVVLGAFFILLTLKEKGLVPWSTLSTFTFSDDDDDDDYWSGGFGGGGGGGNFGGGGSSGGGGAGGGW
ncbi:MAG: TPM domain-containing protein [Tissierellia bacterium]|nr:TPM domain-containing protein [Tissierellia bacterium]